MMYVNVIPSYSEEEFLEQFKVPREILYNLADEFKVNSVPVRIHAYKDCLQKSVCKYFAGLNHHSGIFQIGLIL